MSKTNKFVEGISGFLVLVFIVSLFAFLFRFTNGFSENFKNFYLTYNGKDILKGESRMYLESGKEHRFEVKYIFEGEEGPPDYTVKVLTNVDEGAEFNVTVDGEETPYENGKDITSAFEIEKTETSFTLSIPKGLTLQSVLETLYAGKTVEMPPAGSLKSPYIYTLVVTCKKITYSIDFYTTIGVTGIELDKEGVIF